MKCAT